MRDFLILTLIAVCVSGHAYADCKSDKSQQCLNREKSKSNDSRGGADAYEFCATQAIIACEERTGMSDYTPKLRSSNKCQSLAEKSGNWDKDVYHDCMGTSKGFRW